MTKKIKHTKKKKDFNVTKYCCEIRQEPINLHELMQTVRVVSTGEH